ncbi:MAG TPA: hypothetical protein VJU61_12875 [Polyangiaceae bacterium]|nr:hypothetical protein [Polyangiaceae bacterium]
MRTLSLIGMVGVALLVACDSEQHYVGLTEPIIAQHAELKKGDLPSHDEGVRVTSFQLNFGVITPGAPNLKVSGRVTDDTYGVAFRIAELGTGYWLKPAGAPDPSVPGELTFEFVFSASPNIAPGNHTFVAAAFDENGRAGPEYEVPVCVVSDLPDNQNACDPSNEPPAAIVSLTWHADADVDLSIEAPDGNTYDRVNRSVFNEDGSVSFGLQFDGSTGCAVDGKRRENFVWNDAPEQGGTWLVYANLFDACHHPAVGFEATVYRRKRNGDGTYRLDADEPVRGEFLRVQQNGGVGTPLYLTAIEF